MEPEVQKWTFLRNIQICSKSLLLCFFNYINFEIFLIFRSSAIFLMKFLHFINNIFHKTDTFTVIFE